MRYLSSKDEENDSTPTTKAEELDAVEEARKVVEDLPSPYHTHYDLRRPHEALQHDVEALTNVWP